MKPLPNKTDSKYLKAHEASEKLYQFVYVERVHMYYNNELRTFYMSITLSK
jgi:hypothetical protein